MSGDLSLMAHSDNVCAGGRGSRGRLHTAVRNVMVHTFGERIGPPALAPALMRAFRLFVGAGRKPAGTPEDRPGIGVE